MDDVRDWYGPDSATFGDRLAAARERAGLSQKELAERIGVRLATLRSWENDLAEPRANRLSTVAGLLGVSMTWLLNGEGHGIDAPVEEVPLPVPARDILVELQDLRRELIGRVEQIARLERKLHAALGEETGA